MINKNKQRGVGMMEVLVAMFILSIGILGFVALQARATEATTEALKRSEALTILQGLAERMRLNSKSNYMDFNGAGVKSCDAVVCTSDEQAKADLKFFNDQSLTKNIKIAAIECAQTSSQQKRTCLLAAWDKTNASKGNIPADKSQNIPCLVSNGTKYQDGASCMLMEVY